VERAAAGILLRQASWSRLRRKTGSGGFLLRQGSLWTTWWDLGVGDSTAIWFTQAVFKEVRVIDYLESSGEGLPYYVKKLGEKPYVYCRHHAPA